MVVESEGTNERRERRSTRGTADLVDGSSERNAHRRGCFGEAGTISAPAASGLTGDGEREQLAGCTALGIAGSAQAGHAKGSRRHSPRSDEGELSSTK